MLLDHIKCAAFELPFTVDEQFGQDNGDADLPSILQLLSDEGFVHQADDQFYWVHDSYPADAVSLRSISSDNFVVINESDRTTVIGEVDFASAPSTLHEKAIYIVNTRSKGSTTLGGRPTSRRWIVTTTPMPSPTRRSRSWSNSMALLTR